MSISPIVIGTPNKNKGIIAVKMLELLELSATITLSLSEDLYNALDTDTPTIFPIMGTKPVTTPMNDPFNILLKYFFNFSIEPVYAESMCLNVIELAFKFSTLGITYIPTIKGKIGMPYDNHSFPNVPKNLPFDALNPTLPSTNPKIIRPTVSNQLFLEVATKQAPVSRIKKNINFVLIKL